MGVRVSYRDLTKDKRFRGIYTYSNTSKSIYLGQNSNSQRAATLLRSAITLDCTELLKVAYRKQGKIDLQVEDVQGRFDSTMAFSPT